MGTGRKGCMQIVCRQYDFFSLDMTFLSLPEHQQTIQVSHLALLQVPFPGQGAAKNARFQVKMDNDGRLPYQPNKLPGKWIMGQNTPQVIGNGASSQAYLRAEEWCRLS